MGNIMAYVPTGGKELAVTGAAGLFGMTATQSVLLAALAIVLGGVILAALKLLPRVAVEPMRTDDTGKRRFRLTYNGKLVTWPRKRR